MTTSFVVFSNLIIPLITGLFCLFYFAYFILAHPSRAVSFRLFVVFLIGFSIFLFGRPLQLLIGPYPLPLIIVNIRVFILCSVLAPDIILTALTFNKRITKREGLAVIAACLPLGIGYVVFNTLGTEASYKLFEIAGLVAYDNLTPSMRAPFYGREVTIGVQAVTGLILFLFSLIRSVQLRREGRPKALLGDKEFLINAGILIFALSFILGSLAKQWWIYYVSSIATALLVGGSVLIDIKEVHNYYEKLVPFIKEEIIHNVAFSELSKTKLMEMLRCLGKRTDLNTFAVIKAKGLDGDMRDDFTKLEEIVRVIGRRLENVSSDENFLVLPISDTTVGIVLRLPREQPTGGPAYILGALDDIREEIQKTCRRELAIGIGRSYDRIEELRVSYQEAMNALEYAEQLEGCGIVHAENISEGDRKTRNYPVREKEKLLSLIRSGDVENSLAALNTFFVKFKRYIDGEPEILSIRLSELVCSFIDSAILGGGNEKTLNEFIGKYTGEIAHIVDPEIAERWLAKIVTETAGIVVRVYEKRSKVMIDNAKKYIDTNFRSQLSYREVAREIFISPSYFLSLFKKETGTTFVDYLTSVRVEEAKRLLLTTDLGITQIAYDLGFNNSNYFSNIFRKAVGISATEFRKPRSLTPAS
ncbi:MAG: helix-turn-helix domain-containing protein [Treponemataceae bacterium]